MWLEKGADISRLAGIMCCLAAIWWLKCWKKNQPNYCKNLFWHPILKIVGSHTKRICSTSSNLDFIHMERRGGGKSFESLSEHGRVLTAGKLVSSMEWRWEWAPHFVLIVLNALLPLTPPTVLGRQIVNSTFAEMKWFAEVLGHGDSTYLSWAWNPHLILKPTVSALLPCLGFV